MRHSIFNSGDTTVNTVGRLSEGVAVSGTNTYYSDIMSNKMGDGVGLHLQWTGTPTGTFTFWVSDKPIPGVADDTDWVQDSTNYTAANPAGSADKKQHNIPHRHLWCRIKYVNSSGTGTLFGWMQTTRDA